MDSYFTVALLAPRRRKPPPIGQLTPAELAVLRGFDLAIREHGNPSLREIGSSCDPKRAASNIHKYLHRLAGKGYVRLSDHKARGARLLRPVPPPVKVA